MIFFFSSLVIVVVERLFEQFSILGAKTKKKVPSERKCGDSCRFWM